MKSMAAYNGREIPKEDKVFAASGAALDAVEKYGPEKVINAVPFYTRLWTTSASGVTSSALGMQAARDNADMYGMSLVWNAECEQYYGTVTTQGGDLVELWLEDTESLEAKIAVMRANNLAGIGAWKLGLEVPAVWELIGAYVNGG